MTREQLDALLTLGVRKGVSDVHLEVGYAPTYRVHGALFGARMEPLTPADTEQAARLVLDGRTLERGEVDVGYSIAGVSRFRASVFRQRSSFGLVLRVIPFEIPSLQQLNLPLVVQRLAGARDGLVLVTGATGQGKSTTIAALLAEVNKGARLHIVTIEDPLEFLLPVGQSLVIQREVGADTESFKSALRAALRQDPDVIMVGELRDAETAEVCLRAAETGHLVIATLHTADVLRSIGRFAGLFAPEEQQLARGRLADALKAVVAQRLVPQTDGRALLPACEVMLTTSAIQQAIRDPAKTAELPRLIERSRDDLGAQTFDQHLHELVKAGRVTEATARAHATSSSNLEVSLALDGGAPAPGPGRR